MNNEVVHIVYDKAYTEWKELQQTVYNTPVEKTNHLEVDQIFRLKTRTTD